MEWPMDQMVILCYGGRNWGISRDGMENLMIVYTAVEFLNGSGMWSCNATNSGIVEQLHASKWEPSIINRDKFSLNSSLQI